MPAVQQHARNFFSIIRTMQLDDLRAQIAQPPYALVIGEDARLAQQFAFALAGGDLPDEAAARATMSVATAESLDTLAVGPSPYDAVIFLDPTPAIRRNPTVRRLVADQQQTAVLAILTRADAEADPGIPTLAVTHPTDAAALKAVRARLVPMLAPGRRVPWGRTFTGFRDVVSNYLIEQTARANAQFAIMADLGARIPLLGQFAATGADFLVLTKNQLVLAYELAAIHGRDLDDQKTALTNAAPFFVAGLGWREVARRAVRVVPGAPLVPKAVIAYGGTLATGALARALSNPEGVQAWLKGVQEGTKTGLGVGSSRFDTARQGVGKRVGGLVGAVEDRLGNRTHLTPKWRKERPAIEAEPAVEVIPAGD